MSNKSITLEVDGIRLAGQLYRPGDDKPPPYPVVGICHGIPSGITDPDDPGYPALAERISRRGFVVAIFNFRGCGSSGGNFDLRGWSEDLNALIDHLWSLEETDRSRLSLLGFSAGAAVSLCVAARDSRVAAVAACACPAGFAKLADLRRLNDTIAYFRGIGIIRDDDFPSEPGKWLDGFRQINPLRCIARISPRPLLLVHGSQDELVKADDATQLYRRARQLKQLIIIEGAGHQLRRDERAMAEVIGWLESRGGLR